MLTVSQVDQELAETEELGVAMKICLSLKEVAEALSLSPTTVQQLVREKTFPEPRLLSGRRVGWLAHEVQRWADTRPVARLLPPENSGFKRLQALQEVRDQIKDDLGLLFEKYND
ncbi:AlpA family phage regulatory protein [Paraburkholderia sp. MPAMCS5]|uniref:helix-turn-helix transcriptional regulator n=1 Tax=Paraburkholderia sp. MPAMCS5 TaxID=3112563 RepID=UPI002E18764C|nr:AlpA family phage regulatory protein [Paraburkholderia sp. MPAMCS5]